MHPPQRRPEIEYPCTWTYQVVGSDEAAMRTAVAGLLADRAHTLSDGQRSRTGKYASLKLEVRVGDEGERDSLFAALVAIEGVRLVL